MATGVTEGSSSLEFEPPNYKFTCSPCSKDGRCTKAVCWCVNCEESFCSPCLSWHEKFNMTRDHKILNGERMEDWNKVKAPLLPRERCSEHHSRVMDMYCEYHNLVGCATCMAKNHRGCDGVGYIPDVAVGTKTSEEFSDKKTKNAELITEIKQLKQSREGDHERIIKEKEDILQNIANFKEKVIQKFNELELKAKEETEEQFNKYNANILDDIKKLSDILEEVERNSESLESFVGDNESQLFVHVKKALELSEKIGYLKGEIDSCHYELRFDIDDSILEHTEKVESIGEIVEFSPVSLTLQGNFNVKTKSDKGTCDISGCCFLEDGSLVVTDYANSSVKYLDPNYAVTLHKKLTERPKDICCTGHNGVAIALERHVQFAELTEKITLNSLVCVTADTNGIAYCNKRVFVSCQQEGNRASGRVRIYSVTGTLLKTIQLQMDDYFSHQLLAKEWSGVVAADGKDLIALFDNSGNVLWTFRHNKLKGTICVRVVDDRSLFVLGKISNNLLHVAMGGSRHKMLLSDEDGLNAPNSVAYDKSGQKLIVVSDKTDKIAVYNVKQEAKNTSIHISSLNVRGLGNYEKREKIFTWLKDQSLSIIFLQETHSSNEKMKIWEKQWGSKAYFSGNSSRSKGVAILINNNFNYNIIGYRELMLGRLQTLEIEINDKTLTLINIYGPNIDDTSVFKKLKNYVNSNNEKTFIIGGDFNTVIDEDIDKKNGNENTHQKVREKIKKMIQTNSFIDIWRHRHPDQKQYTFHSNSTPTRFSRLDYFLISDTFLNCVSDANIKNGYKTDHSLINMSIDLTKIDRGPGAFKMNNSILLETE